MASPPAACPPKQRQRLRHQQQQQQQQLLQSEASDQEPSVAAGQDWSNSEPNGSRTPKIPSDGEANKQETEAGDESQPEVLSTSSSSGSGGSASKKLEKISERRERHGKLRHARRLYEKSGEDEVEPPKEEPDELPQPLEEIENEHLVANRAESPRPTAVNPSAQLCDFGQRTRTGSRSGTSVAGHGERTGSYARDDAAAGCPGFSRSGCDIRGHIPRGRRTR